MKARRNALSADALLHLQILKSHDEVQLHHYRRNVIAIVAIAPEFKVQARILSPALP
jgi:hypothetical protein